MAWGTVFSLIGGIAGTQAVQATRDWRDETKACAALGTLFHQTVLDGQGGVRPDAERAEAAGISFTLTRLNVDGLVNHPVYHVEAVNCSLPGDDHTRVRYFGYDTASFAFWLQKPSSDYLLSTPSGWPVLCTGKTESAGEADREITDTGAEWFQRPFATWEKGLWSVPVMWGAFALGKGVSQYGDKKLAEKIDGLVREHCVKGDYRIPVERQSVDVGDLSLRLTPLRNAMSQEQPVEYYVLARHNKLRIHGKRVVAFLYRPGTKLRWI